jgi:ferredoxin-type protein NapH
MRWRWWLARRGVQIAVLAAFAGAPWFGAPLVRGTLASSVWLGTVPLSDPLLVAQMSAAGHDVAASAWLGAALVALCIALIGGRVFCGWVCPINLVTDAVHSARRALGWRGALLPRADRRLRLAVLALVLAGTAASGAIVWEWVNPITIVVRGVAFGAWGAAVAAVVAVVLCDVVLLKNGWCGHLCPVGALYALLGSRGAVRVHAARAEACTHCGACFEHCPEPQVIAPVLRAGAAERSIIDHDCLRCGRCLEVCDEGVLRWQLGPRITSAKRRRGPQRGE